MTPEQIRKVTSDALKVLRAGGLILYPTDTVWGIGCDATNPEAVAKVYAMKRRSDSKSLVMMAADMDMVARYIKVIPPIAIDLVEVNDRPMTIIYPDAIAGEKPADGSLGQGDRYHLAYNAVAADGSVGMRIPMMDFCKDLCARLGRPLISTSANISGEPTPKKFGDISQEIRDAVDYIVSPSIDKESTGKSSQIIKIAVDGQIEIIRA